MKIIIDTNIINKDYKLHGKYIVTLSGAAAKLGYDDYITLNVPPRAFSNVPLQIWSL